jgi:prepilin-type N-terminal cleavage/methylation domain-containing protein
MPKTRCQQGYSLVELILVLVIIGVLASVAYQSLGTVIENRRVEETRAEMERLAFAIAGNPVLVSGGHRTDYGYVGDVGALPPNLDALASNPGGYLTWKGPYIRDELSAGGSVGYFKIDAWGKGYEYSGGTTIISTGSGDPLTRNFASSPSELLGNRISGVILDRAGTPPGPEYRDSLLLTVYYPDGSGSLAAKSAKVGRDGYFAMDSLPIGAHDLQVIYRPTGDTLVRRIYVDPGSDYYAEIHLISDFPGSTSGSFSLIIRPDRAGAQTDLAPIPSGNNWQRVAETMPDEEASYVTNDGPSWARDLYSLEDVPLPGGIIDSIVAAVRCRETLPAGGARLLLSAEGTDYPAQLNIAASYSTQRVAYTMNPATSSAWTWSEMTALEAGVELRKSARCTQLWIEIFYH